jgi:hypothetical protein
MYIVTSNVPLILKVRDKNFFSQAKHIMGHFAGFFEGVKKVENLKKCPIICFAPDKKKFPGLSKSGVHWYFYVLERERE